MLRIGIQLDMVGAYGRDVLRGIMQYANRAGNWEFVMPPMYSIERKKAVSPKAVDGIVAMIHDQRSIRPFRRAGVPVLNVAHTLDYNVLTHLHLPSVLPDDVAIGRLGYDYFRDRGFRNFGFCGHPTAAWSRTREHGFEIAAREAGHECFKVHVADDVPVDWITTVPVPAAIMAANDRYAWHAVDACRNAGLRVPENVAVLGCDNDLMLVDMVRPSLSSIKPAAFSVGYEAGRILAELMQGGRISPEPHLIQPEGIVTRHSTDVLVIEDETVAAAARFIRENAARPIGVEDVLEEVAAGRRTLERRFREEMGRSLLDEIRRVRIERAMQLLRDTSMDMPTIAEKCGFSSQARFATVFRKESGGTPTAYRKRVRGGR
ncbi:MAG TPA: DNA-binding transcriptional regulator [Tepidisphaeraceae bacterium]|nr:DNA-binding transcriptional regulator [Tepidisphaeraceae bacterium]